MRAKTEKPIQIITQSEQIKAKKAVVDLERMSV